MIALGVVRVRQTIVQGGTYLSIMVIRGATKAPAEAAAAASAASRRPNLLVLYSFSLIALTGFMFLGSNASPVLVVAFFHGRTSLASAVVAMTWEGCMLVVADDEEPASAPLMII